VAYRIPVILAFVNFLLLTFYVGEISLSGAEAKVFFEHSTLVGVMSYYSCEIFGRSDIAARAPFLFMHFISTLMLFELSKNILKQNIDRLFAVCFFILLPGVSLSALFINKAGVIIFLTLLFLLTLQRGFVKISYILLACYTFMDNAFAILFLALIFYGIRRDDKGLIFTNILLFAMNMVLFGFNDGGKPKSAFLDTVGVYFAIFSPLVFGYFLFAIYKSFRSSSSEPVLYISFWALIFSLLLSIRQKIQFEDFAPFVVLSVLFMVSIFFNSYRIRLRPFRRGYKLLGYSLIASLLFGSGILFFSKSFYLFLHNPKKNFGYDYHVARELAYELKSLGFQNIKCENKEMALRLKFYGIFDGNKYLLSDRYGMNAKKVSVVYSGVVVATYYVTKVNTF